MCGIRRKHTQDVVQMHRKSNPASHLQRGPNWQSKLTYKAPAPTYTEEDPPVSHSAKGGLVGPAEPVVRPNLDRHQSRCASAGDSPLSSPRWLSMFPYLEMAGTDLSSDKRASTHPFQMHSHTHSKRRVVVGLPLVSLEYGVCEEEDRRRAGLVGLSSSCTSMDTIRLSSSSGKFLVKYS